MSKEIAKKLIAELQTNEELKTKIVGIEDRAELVKKAVEAGYDVTVEELIEAEKEFRKELAGKTDELSPEELESAAGGKMWKADDASDGHESFCSLSYHHIDWHEEHDEWCKENYIFDSKDKTQNHCGQTHSGCDHVTHRHK